MKILKTDIILWLSIALYICVIYSTLSIVPALRKILVERFGSGVFDFVYVVFGILACAIVARAFVTTRGKALFYRLLAIAIIVVIYSYYLIGLPFAIERVHFLEYGLLGILLYYAFYRKVPNVLAIPLAFAATFCIALGDEGIQGALSTRVGEIRDCVTDLFSGALGICLYVFAFGKAPSMSGVRSGQVRFLIVLLFLTITGTAAFLSLAHGFGFVHETDSGRVFSSLSRMEFDEINSGCGASALSPGKMAIYENEALRHLFQRDFYFTNDFLIEGGGYYRDYWKSLCENKIMESYFKKYLSEHAHEKSADLVGKMDKTVAKNMRNISAVWPDSLKKWTEKQAVRSDLLFTSRVKSTIITT